MVYYQQHKLMEDNQMDSVGSANGCQGGGGILKELIDSPMAPHNKLANAKKGGKGGDKDKGCGEGGVGEAGGCEPKHHHHHHHNHNQGNGGGAFIMVGNFAGNLLGG
jgi:hypothetical protein